MKVNNIQALDYERRSKELVLMLTNTTMEAITGMDTALVEVRTDDGDLVEVFAGYSLRAVTCNVQEQTYTAVLTTEASDTTAAALQKLSQEVAEITDAIERGLTL